jgi:hypothetical protein
MGQGKATIGDLIAEAVGALSLAAGMGFSGWVVAAPLGFDPSLIGSGAAFIGLLVGWAVIRAVPVAVVLPDLSIALAPIESVAPGPSTGEDEGELLLDTPIFVPHGDTCVVRLFGAEGPRTPGAHHAHGRTSGANRCVSKRSGSIAARGIAGAMGRSPDHYRRQGRPPRRAQ